MKTHLLHLTQTIKKSEMGDFVEIDMDKKLAARFGENIVGKYKIEFMSQSSVFTELGSVLLTTSIILKVWEDIYNIEYEAH